MGEPPLVQNTSSLETPWSRTPCPATSGEMEREEGSERERGRGRRVVREGEEVGKIGGNSQDRKRVIVNLSNDLFSLLLLCLSSFLEPFFLVAVLQEFKHWSRGSVWMEGGIYG